MNHEELEAKTEQELARIAMNPGNKEEGQQAAFEMERRRYSEQRVISKRMLYVSLMMLAATVTKVACDIAMALYQRHTH